MTLTLNAHAAYEKLRRSISVNSEANARRIALVESCFGSAGQPLNVPGRVLVGEGVLTKACRKKLKPRQFFLFNDLLVYGNIIINKKKYNKQHTIPLEEVKLQSLEDEGRDYLDLLRVLPLRKLESIDSNSKPSTFGFRPIPERVAHLYPREIFCRVCRHCHGETRMDGPH